MTLRPSAAMLEAMPLATDQFGLACTRLQNAQHYLRYTEPGAAWYELRLLASSLKNGEQQVREPQRRLAAPGLKDPAIRPALALIGGHGLRCPLGRL